MSRFRFKSFVVLLLLLFTDVLVFFLLFVGAFCLDFLLISVSVQRSVCKFDCAVCCDVVVLVDLKFCCDAGSLSLYDVGGISIGVPRSFVICPAVRLLRAVEAVPEDSVTRPAFCLGAVEAVPEDLVIRPSFARLPVFLGFLGTGLGL